MLNTIVALAYRYHTRVPCHISPKINKQTIRILLEVYTKPGLIKPGLINTGLIKPGLIKPGLINTGLINTGLVYTLVLSILALSIHWPCHNTGLVITLALASHDWSWPHMTGPGLT